LRNILFKGKFGMGLVLDKDSSALYEKWLKSSAGRSMDGFIRKMIPGLWSPQKNDKVLDIGCGTGNHLLFLNKLGLDISGVDVSQGMIDIARKRLGNSCELKTGQAEDLPFSDNEFDFALLINTMEFLDDPLTALQEAGRVARKKVLIFFINSLSLYSLGARLQGIFSETLIRHIRPYHLWEMKSHIKNAFGPVPVVWRCTQAQPLFRDENTETDRSLNLPFGAILGISITLNPLFRTESLPLKIMVKKVEQPFAEGITTQSQCSLEHNDYSK
jgi:SAM-dependent methyltransferase